MIGDFFFFFLTVNYIEIQVNIGNKLIYEYKSQLPHPSMSTRNQTPLVIITIIYWLLYISYLAKHLTSIISFNSNHNSMRDFYYTCLIYEAPEA